MPVKPCFDNLEANLMSEGELHEYVDPKDWAKRIADRAFAKHKDELVPRSAAVKANKSRAEKPKKRVK